MDKVKVKDWLTPEGLLLIECWARDGLTQNEMSAKMNITPKTLCLWKQTYPEIEKALKANKEIVDYKVENALLKAALGYKTVETKTYISQNPDDSGNRKVRIEKVEKEVGPNVTACLAWLNNRKSKEWQRNRDNEIQLTDENSNVTINIVKHEKEDNKKENKVNNV